MGAATSQHTVDPALATCSCWEVLEKLRRSDAQRREEFELTVSFLASVPLFAKQLPRSELPKMAQCLRQKVWRPGQRLVRQGEIGHTFFLIQDGEASVATSPAAGEPEQVRATLYPGDYFGERTLINRRTNVASIIAKGPEPLVTLSMTRQAWEESNMKHRLRFPKRPAVYLCDNDESEIPGQEEHSQAEKNFICSAIRRNGNLRAFLQEASDGVLQAIAAGAERRSIEQGTVFAQAGTVGRELFIVRSGSIQAFIPETADSCTSQSAEAALAHTTMAERLLRKEHFLQELFGTPTHMQSQDPTPRSGFGRRVSDALACSASGRMLSECSIGGSPCGQTPRREGAVLRRRVSSAEVGHPALHPQLEFFPSSEAQVASSCSSGGRRSSGRQPKQGWKAASKESLMPVRATRSLQGPVDPGQRSPPAAARMSPSSVGGSPRLGASMSPKGGPCATPRGSKVLKRMSLEGGEEADGGRYVTFSEGESFGELSLIYNVRQEADFVASTDSVVYAIERRHFTTWLRGRSQRFNEYSKFLEEVYALSQLLSFERWELACQAQGLVQFSPGECVLLQGKPRQARLWYLIWSGSAVVTQTTTNSKGKEQTTKLADLCRSDHFGERSLLRGDNSSQVTVNAGPHGVCCLTFNGDTVLPILQAIFHHGNNLCPSPTVDIEEWCRAKSRGWGDRQISGGWDRQISTQSAGFSTRLTSKDGTAPARHIELEDLIHVCVLGRGSFGQVILVEDPTTARLFALKTVSKGHVQRKHAERQIKWERELLTMLDSPFLIRLSKTFSDEQHVYFLLEAALGGSLLEVLHLHSEVLMEDQPHGHAAAFYAGCIILALEHMHERRIVHRDIKPDNVLLDSRGYAKLCDMGFARFVLGKTNTRVGTPAYMAPEMIDFPHTHDMSVDWWSLGVLTFELLAGQSPWEDEGISDPMEQVMAIRRSQRENKLRFPYHFPQKIRTFVASLLMPVRSRLGATGGAAAVRQHPMFAAAGVSFSQIVSRSMPTPYVPEEQRTPMVSEMEDLSPGQGDSIYSNYKEDEKESDPSWAGAF